MNLLNPIGLLALLTIPPVVVLYLLKLKRLELRVPSIMLWRAFTQDMQASHPFQKLRFSILLLLQVLVLTLAAMALARPYFQTRAPQGRSVAVILDASLSMQATDVAPSRFEQAREAALQVARSLEPDDEMMAVLAGAQTEVLTSFTRDAGALERAIADAQPSDCRSNLREAFALTMSLAREKQNTQVFVASDGAPPPDLDIPVPDGVEVHYMPVGERCRNVAITALNVRETYGRDLSYQLFVGVRNYGDQQVDCQVEISHDGDLSNVETLHIPPHEQVSHLVEQAGLRSGLIEARIDAADDLPADNVARIVFRERARRKVLIVSEGNLWLERVLGVDPRVEARVLKPAQYDPNAVDAGSFDVTIFDGWAPSPMPRRSCLLVHVAPEGGPVRSLDAELESPTILDWDRKSPLFQYVDWGPVGVAKMMSVKVEPWARGLVDTAAGPLVAAGETEDLRCVFLGFDLKDSNLPVRVAFPILMRNALQWLSSDPAGSEAQSYAAGSPVRVRVPRGTETVTARLPDGTTQEIPVRPETPAPGEQRAEFDSITFDGTGRAGVYDFLAGDKVLERAAFNACDPEESDLTPSPTIALAEGKSAVAGGYVRSTRELWRWLLAAAVLLLTAEWIVFHRRMG
jgi:Ca-activated chloride channel homolog